MAYSVTKMLVQRRTVESKTVRRVNEKDEKGKGPVMTEAGGEGPPTRIGKERKKRRRKDRVNAGCFEKPRPSRKTKN